MPVTINGQEYVTPAEAATRLGVSVGRVRQLLADGKIAKSEIEQVSSRNVILVSAVERYAVERRSYRKSPKS